MCLRVHRIGAFMGRNYWVAGGGGGILDMAEAICSVSKTHFEKMYILVEIARFLYTGVQNRSATRTTETETQSFL